MKPTLLSLIVLGLCLLALLAVGSGAKVKHDRAARRERLHKILQLDDMPTVDPKEFLKTGEKTGHVTEPWYSFAEDVQEFHTSLLGVVEELGRELKAELIKEIKSEGPDFRERWQKAYAKAKDAIAALKTGDVKEKLKDRLKTFEAKMGEIGEKNLKGKWKRLRSKLVEEFMSVEKLLKSDLDILTTKIDKIFHRVEHHMAHKEHHPVLKCGSCGKQLTLREFLTHYPDLAISEEEWWSDIDVENFYLGWPEWANRYAVKCPQCGATDWVGVDFVSAEAEHKLEEQALGEHAQDSPQDIIE
jgi:hypothetical protein